MKLLFNGKIYTENPTMPWAQAVAIDGDSFAAVGTNEEVRAFIAGRACEEVDLEGRTVLPGLIDGHTHPSVMAETGWMITEPMTQDKDELYAKIRAAATKYPKEKMPYFVFNGFMTATFGKAGPRKEDLDELIPDRPARINDDTGHGCWYNTQALELLKDENGVPHSVSPVAGQSFVQDENGEYTGYAFQTFAVGDIGVFEGIGWYPPHCMTDEIAEPVHNVFRSCGVIGYMDAATTNEDEMKYVYQLDKEDRLNLYYEGTSLLNKVGLIEETIAKARDWQAKYHTEHINCRIVKFFGDGSNELGDVLSIVPFSNDPTGTNYGHCNCSMEEMRDVMVRLNREGDLQLHIHICCDGTLHQMLDSVEAAKKICGDDWKLQVSFAHCEMVHPDDVHRFRELGVQMDVTLNWFGAGGRAARPFIGKERMDQMYNYVPMIEDGVVVGMSSDNMSPISLDRSNPYLNFQIAMTRVEPQLEPLDPEEYPGSVHLPYEAKLSLEQVIHGYTMANAQRLNLADKLGSIEVGKKACLVVLDRDIFTTPENEIMKIMPVCHYFDGKELRIPNPLPPL